MTAIAQLVLAVAVTSLLGACGKSPAYLSDTDPAYRKLEQLQRQRNACSPMSMEELVVKAKHTLDEDCATAEHNWMCKEAYQSLETLRKEPAVTRCESAAETMGMRLFAIKLNMVLRKEGITAQPRLGALRTGTINGVNIQGASADQSLVLMNPDLVRVHHEIVRFVTGLFDIYEKDRRGTLQFTMELAAQRVAENPEHARYIGRLLDAVIQGQSLPYSPDLRAPLDEHSLYRNTVHERMVKALSEEAENFVVAHEYAHVVLRHRPRAVESTAILAGDESLPVAIPAAEDELGADRLGQEYWYKVLKLSDLDEIVLRLYPCVPEMLMTTARLLELDRQRLGYPARRGEVSANDRRMRLRSFNTKGQYLCNNQPGDFGEIYHHAAMVGWLAIRSVTDEGERAASEPSGGQ